MILPVGDSSYTITYMILPDASLGVSCAYKPTKSQLPMLPKFGMTTAVPATFNQVRWYGRGPQETYWDRKTGGEIGVHQLTVEEMNFPYVRPQDVGNRSDVRWFSLTDEAGYGIRVQGHTPLNFSAWPYSTEDLEQATHDYELPRRDFVTLNIDHQLQGVGGDNSWGPDAQGIHAAGQQALQVQLRHFAHSTVASDLASVEPRSGGAVRYSRSVGTSGVSI